MTRRDCKAAAVWLAALESGELDEASRIRLHEHLDRCPGCQAQARRIAGMVQLLRQEEPRLRESRRRAIWAQLQEQQHAAEKEHRPPTRGLALVLATVVAVLLLGAGSALMLLRGDEKKSTVAKQSTPPATRQEQGSPPSRPARRAPKQLFAWQLQAGVLVDAAQTPLSGAIASAAHLTVSSSEQAVLTRAETRLTLKPASTLALAADGSIKLFAGRLLVHSTPRDGEREVRVQVGSLVVRPLGTVFAVSYDGHQPPRVEVFEGRVEVAAATEAVQLIAGSQLIWGQEPQPLPDSIASHQTPAAQRDDDLPRRQPPAAGERPRSKRAQPAAPTMLDHLRQIEQLLARGETRLARQRARSLAASKRAGAHLPALLTLIAESLLKEGAYQAARDAYLQVYRTSADSTYGALALFGAGALALEQLGQPAQAVEHLRQYLARFPRGHQREGAHYLLVQALRKLGRDEEADAVVRRYRAAFPAGQYIDRMSIGSEAQTKP